MANAPRSSSTATTASALPVRHALRVAPDAVLARLNGRRRRSGAPPVRPARAVIPEILALGGGKGSVAQCLGWVAHPDERVPIVALARNALDYDAISALVRRALRDAVREGVCWTPLLDALPADRVRLYSGVPEWGHLQRLEALFKQAIAGRRWSRLELRRAIRDMLRFRSQTTAEWVAKHAPRLNAGAIRQLLRRDLGNLVRFYVRRPADLAICTTWAVARLDDSTSRDVPIRKRDFESLAHLVAFFGTGGGTLPLRLAVRVERTRRRPIAGTVDPWYHARLDEVIAAAVRGARGAEMSRLGVAQRTLLLTSSCPEVRLATQYAFGRSRRPTAGAAAA